MNRVQNKKPAAARFTYADYRTWPESERWELVHGEAWNMSPAPGWGHQKLAIIIAREMSSFLKDKPCQPFIAPVDVFLPNPGQDSTNLDAIDTVVQPDLGVVCDSSRITPRGVMGAPDLVMEIISPSSVLRDLNLKKDLYGRHGCREYWVWDANLAWVSRFVRQADGNWDEGTTYDSSQTAESILLPGFRLALPELRAEMGLKD
jgi:Uma2 family endonuclease